MACGFQSKVARLCTCCEKIVLGPGATGEQYRRIHFKLHSPIGPDPNTTFCTFCVECSEHKWDRERLDGLQSLLRRSWIDALEKAGTAEPSRSQMTRWYSTMEVVGVDSRYPTQTWPEVQ